VTVHRTGKTLKGDGTKKWGGEAALTNPQPSGVRQDRERQGEKPRESNEVQKRGFE